MSGKRGRGSMVSAAGGGGGLDDFGPSRRTSSAQDSHREGDCAPPAQRAEPDFGPLLARLAIMEERLATSHPAPQDLTPILQRMGEMEGRLAKLDRPATTFHSFTEADLKLKVVN